MKQKDSKYFSDFEKDIQNELDIHRVSEISNFPFQNLEEIKSAYNNKEIAIAAPYNSDRMYIYGTKGEIIMHYFWLTLPFLIIIADIVLAFITKRWVLLIGVPLAIIGLLNSSPYSQLRNAITAISGLAFIASIFLFDWHWSLIIGSLLFAQIFGMTAREQFKMIITERALQSETFFCWMFYNRIIFVKNNKTGRIIQEGKEIEVKE